MGRMGNVSRTKMVSRATMEMFINQRDDFDSVRVRRGALHSRRAKARKADRKKMNLKTGSLLNIFFYPHHYIYIIAWLDRGFTYKHQFIDMRIMSRRKIQKLKRKGIHPVLTYFFLLSIGIGKPEICNLSITNQ
jgi:hypothetical protein